MKKQAKIIIAVVLIATAVFVFRYELKYFIFGGTKIGQKINVFKPGFPDKLTRNLEGNNILNIRYYAVNDWKGQTGNNGGFCVFNNVENCVRAGAKILEKYFGRGINTIQSIVTTYAPPFENDVNNYVNFVVNDMNKNGYNITKSSVLSIADIPCILFSMAKMEVGFAFVPSLKFFKFASKLN